MRVGASTNELACQAPDDPDSGGVLPDDAGAGLGQPVPVSDPLEALRAWAARQQLDAAAHPFGWLILVDYLPRRRRDGSLVVFPSHERAQIEQDRLLMLDPDAAVAVVHAARYGLVLEQQMRWIEAAFAAA